MHLIVPGKLSLKLNPEKHTVARAEYWKVPMTLHNFKAAIADERQTALQMVQQEVAGWVRSVCNMDPADFVMTYSYDEVINGRVWTNTTITTAIGLADEC